MAVPSDLLLKAQSGDPVSLNLLLLHCRTDIRSYAQKHCHISDVEDAIQESLIGVVRGLPGLRKVQAFSGWLLTIVKRECHKALRRAYLWPKESSDKALNSVSARSDLELQMILVSALESLPPHYLKVILLRDFEELSVQDIAQELGEAEASVKSRIHRARTMIREYLK